MTKDLVINFLREEGYAPKIDNDGDIVFKAEGITFLYYANDDDQEYFQLAVPAIYDVTDDNRDMVLEACNAICIERKSIKAFIVDSDVSKVWVCFEIFIDSTPEIGDFMPRAIRALLSARLGFYEKVR